MTAALQSAEAEGRNRREARPTTVEGALDGIYVVFESFPGVELALESLDPRQGRRHPELLSVQRTEEDGEFVERATVFVPDGTLGYFLRRLEDYLATVEDDTTRHRKLVDRIQSIGLASLTELWTDPPNEFPPGDELVWWELWLRRRDGHEVDRLAAFAEAVGVRLGRASLGFADRTVVLIEARASLLASALDVLDDLAELRRPREIAELIALEPAIEQAEWVDDLAQRTESPDGEAPAVCVVDTGVHQGHPLLAPSLTLQDCHACDPTWGPEDRHGHGTEMAGLALYGDLGAAVVSGDRVRLRHCLESVKLVNPPRANPPELWGSLTATAASRVEIEAPTRRRVFSMAITAAWWTPQEAAPEIVLGQPSSWSAALDALAAGLAIEVVDEGMVFLDEDEESVQRLFIVAAGNVRERDDDYLERSDLEPVEDPGQAWNALTVGAYTERDSLDGAGDDWDGYSAVAPRGELSPHSRTSTTFQRAWPIKPDVVLEGGNLARSPAGTGFDTPEILQVLTTKAPLYDQRLFTVTCATSAATSQAGYLAGEIMAEYPAFWPETVRALIVHSAEWTPAMKSWFDGAHTRAARVALHRRYGMGVPDLLRATRSASDALTLVVQDIIHPFDGEGRMRELHLHDLPWPTDVLAELGGVEVRLRVTLSYFIEPNAGRRGWARRYSYASHGLRFDVRRATESTDEFRKRINLRALAEEERRPTSDSDAAEWFFGPDQRTVGSLHTDYWTGTAADLAQRGAVAVYPVTGWWKQRKDRDHSERGARYALVVSIETPEQDVDIWTPVTQEVGIPIETQVET